MADERSSEPRDLGETIRETVAPARRDRIDLAALPVIEIGREGDELAGRRVLGEGGMGRVVLAWQRSLEREVAIKTVQPDASPVFVDALISEALVAGALEHPVIPPIHALGRDGASRPLIVMKRIDGTRWSELIADDDHPAWAATGIVAEDRLGAHVRILARIADAVHFAHGRGYLHRDIKPDNVVIGTDGEAYLLDWGIAVPLAAVTEGCDLLGTPRFMAPEMANNEPLDVRTDVYLLGATLHAVLTKTPRHGGTSMAEVIAAASASEPVAYPPSVPAELAQLANTATARDPAARPTSARELRIALDRFLVHRGASELARRAGERLADLERALLGELDPADARLATLITEARFGFAEAQRLYPDSPEIAQGVARVRRAAVRLEIRRGNAAGARALLGVPTADDAEVVAELAALERSLVEAAERHRALSQHAHDTNPAVAIQTLRWPLAIGFAIITGIVTVASLRAPVGDGPTPAFYVWLGVVFFAVAMTATAVLWRKLGGHALSRRLLYLTIATTLLLLFHRWTAWRNGLPFSSALLYDVLIFTAINTAIGILAMRIWLVAAILAASASVAVYLDPGHARPIVIAMLGSATAVFVFAARAPARAP